MDLTAAGGRDVSALALLPGGLAWSFWDGLAAAPAEHKLPELRAAARVLKRKVWGPASCPAQLLLLQINCY